LACRVPNLQLDLLAVNRDHPCSELDSDRQVVHCAKRATAAITGSVRHSIHTQNKRQMSVTPGKVEQTKPRVSHQGNTAAADASSMPEHCRARQTLSLETV